MVTNKTERDERLAARNSTDQNSQVLPAAPARRQKAGKLGSRATERHCEPVHKREAVCLMLSLGSRPRAHGHSARYCDEDSAAKNNCR